MQKGNIFIQERVSAFGRIQKVVEGYKRCRDTQVLYRTSVARPQGFSCCFEAELKLVNASNQVVNAIRG